MKGNEGQGTKVNVGEEGFKTWPKHANKEGKFDEGKTFDDLGKRRAEGEDVNYTQTQFMEISQQSQTATTTDSPG